MTTMRIIWRPFLWCPSRNWQAIIHSEVVAQFCGVVETSAYLCSIRISFWYLDKYIGWQEGSQTGYIVAQCRYHGNWWTHDRLCSQTRARKCSWRGLLHQMGCAYSFVACHVERCGRLIFTFLFAWKNEVCASFVGECDLKDLWELHTWMCRQPKRRKCDFVLVNLIPGANEVWVM